MDSKDFMPDETVIAAIRKDIEQYESERRSAHSQVKWRVPVFLLIPVVIVLVLAIWFNRFADRNEQWSSTPHVFAYFFGLVALLFLYTSAMGPATRLQKSFRERLLPIIFGFIKDVRYENMREPGSFDRLPREAIGGFNRQSFDDVISGNYEGFAFELYEASLRQKAGKSESVVFKGVIVFFETLASFPGTLVATRKSNQIASFFRGIFSGGKLEEIDCGAAELDAIYDFRTDNADAARPLVQGRLAKALKWLGEAWPEQPARIALHGSDGFLILPTSRNFFELPGIAVPLDYTVHIRPIIADMVSLLATASLVRQVQSVADEAG